MMDLIINVMGLAVVILAVVVFIDAKRNNVEKKVKWALLMLINPFALKKYLNIRNKTTA